MDFVSNPAISVAIGLSFAFGSVALASAALCEGLAAVFKLRSKVLLEGLKYLLNGNAALITALYQHALVNPLEQSKTTEKSGTPTANVSPKDPKWVDQQGLMGWILDRHAKDRSFSSLPSYVDPKAFAVGFIDAIGATQRDFDSIRQSIAKIDDPQIRNALQAMYVRADGNIDRFETALSTWFDSAMDRVSGLYKRYAQWISFMFAFAIVAFLNVDANHIATTLWAQAAASSPAALKLPASAPTDAADAIAALQQLPVGWDVTGTVNWFYRIAGWLTTALASLLGAPFWFDTLQRFVQLRSSGPKPTPGNPTTDKPTR